MKNYSGMLVFLFIAGILALTARKLIILIHQIRRAYTLIEITPLAFDDKPMDATSALFTALYTLTDTRTIQQKLLGQRHTISAEIVSTKTGGIRYLIRAPNSKSKAAQNIIKSYLNDAKVKLVSDHLKADANFKVLRFVAKKHFAYPLQNYEELSVHDPIGYITAAMTQLEDDELVNMQLIIEPKHIREAGRLRQKILHNDTFLPHESNRMLWLQRVTNGINIVNFGITDMVTTSLHPETYPAHNSSKQRQVDRQMQVARGDIPARQISYFEQELVSSISEKLKQPLFKSDIRFVINANSKSRYKEIKESIQSAMGLYEVPKYQGFKLRRRVVFNKLQSYKAHYRIASFTRPLFLASSELASLYHFPNSENAKTEDIARSLSKTLPAPLSLKDGSNLDVLIGENVHHGRTTPIGLTEAERQRHMYVIGGTGNGKTTMLKYQIVQDIQNGKGVAVVDPHGDLAEELLGFIPEHRIKDVIYLNPDDLDMPIGVNLLELPVGISGNDLLREKDRVTESAVSVLRKIFSEDDTGGHRIEYVLRNTIQTALTLDEANLFTIFRLLNDRTFRNKATSNLEDQDLKNFWKQELGKAGDMQRVKMAAGITAKIGRFLFSASARKMLEQNKSTINFEQIMDEQKILICNFSKGTLGEDTSALFGITILAKLQLASLRRAMQKQADRKPYYLYVDEFQNFATMGFVQMLSEARKYKLFLIMAEQSTQQQDEQRLVDIVLANVGTVVAFRSGSPADERFVLPLFAPYIAKGEIANLPAYTFYCRISAIKAQEPMSGETTLLSSDPDEEMAIKVKESSRKTYGYSEESKPAPKQKNIKNISANQTGATNSLDTPDEIL